MSSTRRCPICVGEYDSVRKRPLVLGCGHTFCHECLYYMITDTYRACAVCRKSWGDRGVNDLPECYQLLPNDVSSDALICRTHNSQQLFWCVACEAKLCRKCLRQQHSRCDWVLIEEQADQLKLEMIEKVSETEQNIRDSLVSIETIIRENKTILDLQKNLRKVFKKMNGEYTIYQQRIILLQSKLSRQTAELEKLRTDWVIPPGGDFMSALRDKMSDLEGVQAIVMWPQKPHMNCFNGLVANFQKCRESNYAFTDVCDGLDLPLTDDESEPEAEEGENDEEIEAVEQEHDNGDEETPNVDDAAEAPVDAAAPGNSEPENAQFLSTPGAPEASNSPAQASLNIVADPAAAASGIPAPSSDNPFQNWLAPSSLGQSTRSVSTQFSLRPVFSFFGEPSAQSNPFPLSTCVTSQRDTANAAESSMAPPLFSSLQMLTSTGADPGQLGSQQMLTSTGADPGQLGSQQILTSTGAEPGQLGSQQEVPSSSSTIFEIPRGRVQSSLNFASLFASGRASGGESAITSTTASAVQRSPLFSLGIQPSEDSRSISLPKFPFSSPPCSEAANVASTTTVFATFQFTPTTNDGGLATTNDGGLATTNDGGLATTNDGGLATTNDGGLATTNDGGLVSTSNQSSSVDATATAGITSSCPSDRQCHAKASTSSSTVEQPISEESTAQLGEVTVEPTLPSSRDVAPADSAVTETQPVSLRADETQSLDPAKLNANDNPNTYSQMTADGGENSAAFSILETGSPRNAAKKIHLQANAMEDMSQSSGDSVTSSPRTDTLSRDVTDEDSVRGQMRLAHNSDMLRAFKKAVKELRRLKKSLKPTKSSRAKAAASDSSCAADTRARESEAAAGSSTALGASTQGSAVRPKLRDAGAAHFDSPEGGVPTSTCASGTADRHVGRPRLHKTLHSECRKFLRRGGPFRRRLRTSPPASARAACRSPRAVANTRVA